MEDLYVDNLSNGMNSKDGELQIYEQGKQMFKEMSINLGEWGSNPQTPFYTSVKESYDPKIYTKRQILNRIASIFDPLGFFSPSPLHTKLLLRDLWKMDVQWGKPIKDQYADRWKEINEDLSAIKEKKLQRVIRNKEAELLCFCNASSKTYGTTIYLQCQKNSQTITNLIFSTSRIAPLKEIPLPRLELLAVLIGTRSINFITQSLQLEIHRKTLWTDSQCILHWLKSKKILTPFVQKKNR